MVKQVAVGPIDEVVVAIDKSDVFALRHSCSNVPRTAQSLILLRYDLENIWLFCLVLGKNGSTIVKGSVIHANDFPFVWF